MTLLTQMYYCVKLACRVRDKNNQTDQENGKIRVSWKGDDKMYDSFLTHEELTKRVLKVCGDGNDPHHRGGVLRAFVFNGAGHMCGACGGCR